MRIAVVGSYGVGLTMRVPRMPEAGETLSGGEFAQGPGGKGSNQAIGAARLGAEVALLTAVGDDGFRADALALWEEEGVDASAVLTVPGASTMVGIIVVEPSGENRIVIAEGALASLDDAAVEAFRPAIAGCDILVASMEIPLGAVVAALRAAREEGVRTLLNPAPAVPLPDDAWPLIDVLTPNQTEARILLGDAAAGLDEPGLAAALAARSGGVVVLTRGAAGALVADAGGILVVDPVPVASVVDTTGAGDSFTAALAVALADGASPADAARLAARAGAHAVMIAGVIPSLPRLADLEADSPGEDPAP